MSVDATSLMPTETAMLQALSRLEEQLVRYPRLAVALSGGVDSMTLACVAYCVLGEKVMLLPAVSPAVPVDASDRVREHAQRLGWSLTVVEAGEFSDEGYRSHPINYASSANIVFS